MVLKPICCVIFSMVSLSSLASSAVVEEVSKMPNSDSAEGALVYIIQPLDGQVLDAKRPIEVRFGLRGMGVAPAGVIVEKTGHHHLLIDQQRLPNLTKPLPASAEIIHFGGGQTQTEIQLEAGRHSLQLVLGNQYHIPHSPPVVSKKITILVE